MGAVADIGARASDGLACLYVLSKSRISLVVTRVLMFHEEKEAAQSKWFLVQHKPNSLGLAQSNLERQGFACFAPRERRSVRRSGKFVTAYLPVFPFVTLNPVDGSWRMINSADGVIRKVRRRAWCGHGWRGGFGALNSYSALTTRAAQYGRK